MAENLIKMDGVWIAGIKTRTTNQEEMNGAGRIGSLWSRFYADDILGKLPQRQGGEVFGVYYNYETDASGPYDLLVGVKVPPNPEVPEGLEAIHIPAQSYYPIECVKGPMPDIVVQGWQKVWLAEKNKEINRKYSFDMEVYPKSPEEGVKIFVAVGVVARSDEHCS